MADISKVTVDDVEYDIADEEARARLEAIEGIITSGTEDLVAGESKLETGKIYFVYE